LWQINEKWQCGARYSSATTVNLKGETDIILGPFSFTDSFKADLDFPSSAGLGLAYKPCQKLTLAFGGNWYGYSKNADTLVLKFKKLGIEKGQYMNWKDNTGFHIGAVYELTPAWTLRAGLARGYAAIPDDTVSTLTPDVTGWDVSGGVEFRKNALRIAAHTILGWGRNTVGPSWNQDVYSATVISCGLTGSWQF